MRDINDQLYFELTDFQKKVYCELEDTLFDYKKGEIDTEKAIRILLYFSSKIADPQDNVNK